MKLVQAVLQFDGRLLRRPGWPFSVGIYPTTDHKVGAAKIRLCDVDSDEREPRAWEGQLVMVCPDPAKRHYARKDVAPGISYSARTVVRFELEEWQPTIEDMFATDWEIRPVSEPVS